MFFTSFMAALVLSLMLASGSPAIAAEDEQRSPGITIPHLTTADFLRTVGSAEVPVVVQFDARWCVYCKALQPHIDKLREEKGDKLAVYKVNADFDPDLMNSYEVRTLPTMIVFYEGRIVGRSDGSMTEKELFEWIDAVEKDIEKSHKK